MLSLLVVFLFSNIQYRKKDIKMFLHDIDYSSEVLTKTYADSGSESEGQTSDKKCESVK